MRLTLISALLAGAATMGCAERDEIIATVPAPGEGGAGGSGGSGPVFSFAPTSEHDVACGEANDLATADVDGDGVTDLLVGGDCLNVHHGDGNGDFGAPGAAVSANFGAAFVVGHVDTNHPDQPTDPIDLVSFAQQARVFIGDGMGGFAHLSDVPAAGPGQVGGIGLANLYGDASLELITSSAAGLSVWTGDGTGAFVGPHPLTLASRAVAQAHGDMNGDMHADLVVAADSVSVLLNQGGGDFGAPLGAEAAGTHSIVLLDADGDDCLDVIAIDGRTGEPASADGRLQLLRNDCAGGLTTELLAPLPFATAVAAADIDGDDVMDLITARAGSEPALLVMRGHGEGRFEHAHVHPLAGEPGSLVTADFNGDGRTDAAVALPGRGATAVLLNETL